MYTRHDFATIERHTYAYPTSTHTYTDSQPCGWIHIAKIKLHISWQTEVQKTSNKSRQKRVGNYNANIWMMCRPIQKQNAKKNMLYKQQK